MDDHRFDHLARLLGRATVRRRLLAGLAISPIAGVVAARLGDDVAARKKRRKKGKNKKAKKPQPNAYGCLNVGQPCNGDSSLCCSGICEGTAPTKGKKDSSRCVGHDEGACFPDADTCAIGVEIRCHPDNEYCACVKTTGGATFCGDFALRGACRECSRDVDCQAEFGAGAACLLLDGACSGVCPTTGRTACALPCPDASE